MLLLSLRCAKHKATKKRVGMAPLVLSCGSSWTLVVSFVFRSLYRQNNVPRYTSSVWVSVAESRSGFFEENKNSLPLLGIESNSSVLPFVAQSLFRPLFVPYTLSKGSFESAKTCQIFWVVYQSEALTLLLF
jgi:hypothetical protein